MAISISTNTKSGSFQDEEYSIRPNGDEADCKIGHISFENDNKNLPDVTLPFSFHANFSSFSSNDQIMAGADYSKNKKRL